MPDDVTKDGFWKFMEMSTNKWFLFALIAIIAVAAGWVEWGDMAKAVVDLVHALAGLIPHV